MHIAQLHEFPVEADRLGSFPELADGGDELLRPLVARIVVDPLAHLLELALDAAGHDVQVHAPARNLAERGRHLREEAGVHEAGAHGDEKTYLLASRRERRHHRPGLRQGGALVEKPVGKARGDEHGVEAVLLRRLHHLAQVFKRGRTLGPQRADVRAVTVDRNEPVEARRRTFVIVGHAEYSPAFSV